MRKITRKKKQVQKKVRKEEAHLRFDYPPHKETFVFKLTEPGKIKKARDILSGKEKQATHVNGLIVKKPAIYNHPWSFHLEPTSIGFFEFAMEVCDASIQYVEDHLDEVGGHFLPENRWCPWGSRLIEEVEFEERRRQARS